VTTELIPSINVLSSLLSDAILNAVGSEAKVVTPTTFRVAPESFVKTLLVWKAAAISVGG